jgi:aspartyl-tRNA(Asn)/glutamyl-tRNA(Gln) amidotransferase subunit A
MSEIDFLSIAELGARYRRKTLSPVEVTARALARIKALDGKLNAFVTLLEKESLAEAATAERELAGGASIAGRSTACPSPSRT